MADFFGTSRYDLPDQGCNLVLLAGELGGADVAAEVDRVRRADGVLAQADVMSYSKPKDGPLFVLNSLLSLESVCVAVWGAAGFGVLQRRGARRQIEKLCRGDGVEAGVDWAMANGSMTDGSVARLREALTLDRLVNVSFSVDFIKGQLNESLIKWKPQRGQSRASSVSGSSDPDAGRSDTGFHGPALNAGDPLANRGQDALADAPSEDIGTEAGRVRSFLDARRPSVGPISGRWALGIGELIASHPRVPRQLHGVLKNLDRYGGVAISDQSLAIDGDEIAWTSVNEIRTTNFVEYLLSGAIVSQLDALPIPRFPGRRKLLDALSQSLLTLLIAAAKKQLDDHQDIQIPAEVRYRGVLRQRRVTPGILATLILADPAVNQCLVQTAQARGVAVSPDDSDRAGNAEERANALRARLASFKR